MPKFKMDKKRIKRLAGITAILASLTLAFRVSDKYFEMAKSLDIMAAVYRDLNAYYVDSISPSSLMQTGIEAMAQSLDPYTYYFSEDDLGDLDFQATGKYGGVGTSIRKIGDSIVVSAVYTDAPFEQAGIRPGDIILSLDGTPTEQMSLEQISNLLRGDPGTFLNVVIRHPLNQKISRYKIERKQVEVNSVAYAGILPQHTGYIKLIQFTEGTTTEITKAYHQLKKQDPALNSLMLDLRGNPGGLLEEAVSTANLFLPVGDTILRTRGRINTWDRTYTATEQPLDQSTPLAVLIDSRSASAAEIVAGAIQDLDRGIIVGQRSFGKGLVQTTRDLPYHTKIKITTARYYTPSGRCIQAIDYGHRNDDGSVAYIPDSLKKDFHTKDGRMVTDGGGIAPDKTITPGEFSPVAGELIQRNLIFNYATLYTYRHPKAPENHVFQLTDSDYNDFVQYLQSKRFTYETRTEAALKRFKSIAREEGSFDKVNNAYEELSKKIEENKPQDLVKHKSELKNLLAIEIMSRYYFQDGRIMQELPSDSSVQAAIGLLHSDKAYHELLNN